MNVKRTIYLCTLSGEYRQVVNVASHDLLPLAANNPGMICTITGENVQYESDGTNWIAL